jgi:hypothetical protein
MKNDPILDQLSTQLSNPSIVDKLNPILTRVESKLIANSDWPQAWEPLKLDLFGSDLPISIKSCWFFVLRSGVVFGAERHPNSHQRSLAFKGSALFEVFVDGVWSACPIDSVGTKAISIPANTWHRIKIGSSNFISLSFHTVSAKELVEETPVNNDLSVTQQRLYHA